MHEPPHVPQLRHDPAAGVVHRLDDRPPRGDLRARPQPGRERPAQALLADPRGLGDDQPGLRALRVVARHDRRRHVVTAGAGAGERGHQDAVRCGDGTETDRIEEGRHDSSTILEVS
jgi:hypothetical protein